MKILLRPLYLSYILISFTNLFSCVLLCYFHCDHGLSETDDPLLLILRHAVKFYIRLLFANILPPHRSQRYAYRNIFSGMILLLTCLRFISDLNATLTTTFIRMLLLLHHLSGRTDVWYRSENATILIYRVL